LVDSPTVGLHRWVIVDPLCEVEGEISIFEPSGGSAADGLVRRQRISLIIATARVPPAAAKLVRRTAWLLDDRAAGRSNRWGTRRRSWVSAGQGRDRRQPV